MSFWNKLFGRTPPSRNRDPYCATACAPVVEVVDEADDVMGPLMPLEVLGYYQEMVMLFEGALVDNLLARASRQDELITETDVQVALCAAADELLDAVEADQGTGPGAYVAEKEETEAETEGPQA